MNTSSKTIRGLLALSIALAMLAANCPELGAQTPAAPGPAPRIGLALSGGGARGMAHVGVLKVLEEMRIPISCVTGTSMGSIVGGTFAAGRAPAEMEKLVLAANWDEIFRDRPPREEIAVPRKIDDYKTLFAPEFGVKDGGLALPKGVIAGVSIETYFRTLSTPAFGITDFNKLPIPFRAVATDIETGQAVVLDHGSLAQAMRASMSVPGAISPVEMDGRLLVDGGIANNLPIDVARKLCGDVIIAVNISTPPLKRAEITSALSVVGQLINFLGMENVDKQLQSLGPNDVLIAPDLGDISAATFERSKDAIRIGEEATRAMADKLKRYSLPPEQYAALRKTQVAEAKGLGTVDEIRVEGLKKTNPAVALGLVESKPGEPLTEEKVGADLRRIYGTKDYESITYSIVGGDVGPRAMVIQPTEKSWGSDYLRFGLGVGQRFPRRQCIQRAGPVPSHLAQPPRRGIGLEGQVGQNTHILGQFYQPVTESGRWFIAPTFYIGQQTRGVFEGDNKVADYLVSLGQGGVDVGATLGTWGQVRVGPVWSKVFARARHRRLGPAIGAPDDGGHARRAFPRPGGLRLVPARGLGLHRQRLRGDDVVRVGSQLPETGGLGARDAELGAAHGQLRRLRRHRARLRDARVRIVHARRPAAPVGLPDQPALGPGIRVRPGDVLQPDSAAARPPRLGRLRRRLRGSRLDDRQPLQSDTAGGHAVVRLGVPRRRHLHGAGLPRRRLCRGRTLEPVSIAGCAIAGHRPSMFHAVVAWVQPDTATHVLFPRLPAPGCDRHFLMRGGAIAK